MKLSKAVCSATLSLMTACLVQAQATRTWVSGTGDDANPCSRTAPCKTFPNAQSKTAASGEINVIDPGGFGVINIVKSLTIDAGGGPLAGIISGGSNGITINAGPNDVVTLRNLDIDGNGVGINGIRFVSGKELRLEHVVIYGFTGHGVSQEALGSSVFITDSSIHNNAGDGVFVPGGGGSSCRLTVLRSSFESNGIGMVVKDNARAVAQDSSFSKNTGAGVQGNANLGIGLVEISLEHCLIAHNGGAGVLAGDPSAVAPSDLWISNNEIVNNVGNGVLVSTNGHVFTYSNNRIDGNGTDGCPGCSTMSLN